MLFIVFEISFRHITSFSQGWGEGGGGHFSKEICKSNVNIASIKPIFHCDANTFALGPRVGSRFSLEYGLNTFISFYAVDYLLLVLSNPYFRGGGGVN